MRGVLLGLFVLCGACGAAQRGNGVSFLRGHDVGSGGDAVLCREAYPVLGGKSRALLDYFEARSRNLVPDLGGSDLDPDQKVALLIERIARHDPDRAALYRGYHASFWNEATILANARLPDIPDDGPLSLPGSDCELMQAAMQKEPELPGDRRYYISGEVWERLDDDERAGLVMHEIMYREAKSQGHPTSTRVRYFHGLIAADQLATMTLATYAELLENTIKLPGVRTIGENAYALRGMTLNDDGGVASAHLVEPSFRYLGFEVPVASREVRFLADGEAVVHASGYNGPSGIAATLVIDPKWPDCKVTIYTSMPVVLGAEGRIRQLGLGAVDASERPSLSLQVCDASGQRIQELSVSYDEPVVFADNHVPTTPLYSRKGPLDSRNMYGLPVLHESGVRIPFRDGERFRLNANGYLDIDLTPDLSLDRPDGDENIVRGDDHQATITIGINAEAQSLFDALSGFPTEELAEGDRRAFVSPRQGFVVVCMSWRDHQRTTCRITLKTSFTNGLISDVRLEQEKDDRRGHVWFINETGNYYYDSILSLFMRGFRGSQTSCSQYSTDPRGYAYVGGAGFEICLVNQMRLEHSRIIVSIWDSKAP